MAEPGSWSDETYFGVGAVWGFISGLTLSCEIVEKLVVALAIAVGAAVVGGFLGVALREDILELIVFFWF